MTNKLKTKLLLLFLGVLTFTFFNCEYDEKANTPENQNSKTGRYKIQRKKINDLLLDKKVSSLVKNYPTKKEVKNGLTSRTIYAEDDNFYIDTEQSIYIEDTESNYSSYTFTVYRTETDSTNYLENLVLSFPDDDHYQLTLIRYELTTQEKQDLENGIDIDLSDNTITVTPIEDSDFGAELSGRIFLVQDGDCFSFIQTSCSFGNHPDGIDVDGSNCPGHHEEELWTFCNSVVIDPTPSSSGGGGGGGSGGGSSSTSNNDGEFDPNLDAHGGGITAPLPDLEEIKKTPCEKVENIFTKNSTLKSELIDLETKTSENDEYGKYKTSSSNDILDAATGSSGYVDFPSPNVLGTYEKYEMIAHTHNSPANSTYAVFSWDDLDAFAKWLKNGKISSTKFVAFLITADGTRFAMTINDTEKFSKFFAQYGDANFDPQIGIKCSDAMKNYYNYFNDSNIIPEIDVNDTAVDNTKAFLQMIQDNDMGLSLFEVDSNYEIYEELTYNPVTDQIDKNPCQ